VIVEQTNFVDLPIGPRLYEISCLALFSVATAACALERLPPVMANPLYGSPSGDGILCYLVLPQGAESFIVRPHILEEFTTLSTIVNGSPHFLDMCAR
jgi:hypothetical protein